MYKKFDWATEVKRYNRCGLFAQKRRKEKAISAEYQISPNIEVGGAYSNLEIPNGFMQTSTPSL